MAQVMESFLDPTSEGGGRASLCGAVPTRSSLRRRGLDMDPSFPVCGHEEESIDHLFLHCPLAHGCWFVRLGLRVEPELSIHGVHGGGASGVGELGYC